MEHAMEALTHQHIRQENSYTVLAKIKLTLLISPLYGFDIS